MDDWQHQLDEIIQAKAELRQRTESGLSQRRLDAVTFLRSVALPALEEFQAALEARGRTVQVGADDEHTYSVHIAAEHEGTNELDYTLQVNVTSEPETLSSTVVTNRWWGERVPAQGQFKNKAGMSTMAGTSKDDVIRDLLMAYKML